MIPVRLFNWLLVILLLGMPVAGYFLAAKQHLPRPPVMRPVDHPRCFPPGTLDVERFSMCPDSRPDMRSA